MKALGIATPLALLIGMSPSHVQAEAAVRFELKDSKDITLAECMEAMENGRVMPELSEAIGKNGTYFVVVYQGSLFGFYVNPEAMSFCNKKTPTNAD